MRRYLAIAVTLVLSAFAFYACTEDEPEPNNDDNTSSEMGTLVLNFKLIKDNETIQLYENITLDTLTLRIEGLKFYTDNVTLNNESNSNEQIIDMEENHINANTSGETASFSFEPGNYSSISFDIGLDSTANHGDPSLYESEHPLSSFHNTHWSWAQGYKFLMLEGKFDSNGDGTPNQSFSYHIGNDEYLKTVSFQEDITINKNETTTIQLHLDFPRILNDVDIKNESFSHSTSNFDLVEKIATNYQGAFSIVHE